MQELEYTHDHLDEVVTKTAFLLYALAIFSRSIGIIVYQYNDIPTAAVFTALGNAFDKMGADYNTYFSYLIICYLGRLSSDT